MASSVEFEYDSATQASVTAENACNKSEDEPSGARPALAGSEDEPSGAQNALAGSEDEPSGAQNALAGSEDEPSGAQNALAGSEDEPSGAQNALAGSEDEPSTSQRARAERNRLRARALRDARLVRRQPAANETGGGAPTTTGGGFMVDEPSEPARRAVAPSAPVADPTERPPCLECERPFAQSRLLDTFGHPVCDECRDDEGAHALLTRTEAKSEFLLRDADLDARQPPLACVRRRNPHSARFGDMRLYLRAQVEARALLVWSSQARLVEERERRATARGATRERQTARRLRALRMDVRSSLYERVRASHVHDFGPERRDEATDEYSRVCSSCGHVETYEKM